MDGNEQRRHLERIRNEARDLLECDPLVDGDVRRSAQRIVEAAQLVLDAIGRPPKPPAIASPTRDLPREGTAEDGKYQLAVAALDQGDFNAAEVALRESVRLNAGNMGTLFLLAQTLLANPRYERTGTLPVVRSLLDRAVLLSPDNAEARALHDEVVREMGG